MQINHVNIESSIDVREEMMALICPSCLVAKGPVPVNKMQV